MSENRSFVVVGAGQAGGWIARTLRAEGFTGRLILIGDEHHAPYERPPLSKSILSGASEIAAATLLTADEATAKAIEIWAGQRVTAINAAMRTIHLSDGCELAYDTLFLATGGRARTLPGYAAVDRLHVLRSFDDALRLKTALTGSRELIIVGGGWIGLEVAATARAQGLGVTLIEVAPRLCARSAPPAVSNFLERLHRSHGVRFRLGAAITSIEATGLEVRVEVSGETLTAEHLLFGIGMSPAAELAAAAGLVVEDGIVVDASGRTSDSNIFAAGDVTRHPSRLAGELIRLESWANAQNQAIVAAKAALGQDVVYDDTPWAWSDQYDVNLQIIGFPERAKRVVARGSLDTGPCCWASLNAEDRVIGGCAANAPRDLRILRKALTEDIPLDLAQWTAISVGDGLIA